MKTSAFSHTPFKALKKILASKQFALNEKVRTEDRTDEEIFSEAMADVREIREFRQIPPKDAPKIKSLPEKKDPSLDILEGIVRGETKIRISDTGEYIEWASPSIRKDIARRLHEGDFSVQDSIDLHGLTLNEAEEAFRIFFRQASRRQLFCVKVIHGRGLRSPNGPVLKEALRKWLHGAFRKEILAYTTARDCDGGLGATYIILKSK